MRRLAITAVLVTVASIVLLPAAAFGKGASEATLSGPGLAEPITLAGEGKPGGETLMEIAQTTGFFAEVFGQSPDPTLEERPAVALGPKYTVTYVMPGPNREEDTLVQDLYPYTRLGVVSYMKPGQPFWTSESTTGGWFVAGTYARDLLVAVGLPTTPPDDTRPSDSPWTILAPALVLVAVAALGWLAMGLTKRRGPQTA